MLVRLLSPVPLLQMGSLQGRTSTLGARQLPNLLRSMQCLPRQFLNLPHCGSLPSVQRFGVWLGEIVPEKTKPSIGLLPKQVLFRYERCYLPSASASLLNSTLLNVSFLSLSRRSKIVVDAAGLFGYLAWTSSRVTIPSPLASI